MSGKTLLEYFQPNSRPAGEIAVVWKRGYRTVRWSYAELLAAVHRFAFEFDRAGIVKSDPVMIWGENSGEWVAAFIACILSGVVAVPMDAIAEKRFAKRVAAQAGVKLSIAASGVPELEGVPTMRFDDVAEAGNWQHFSRVEVSASDPVQIVFTSGTTAEPRGVVITHGNVVANLEPIEKEFARYRRYERLVHPLRILDLLPLSHVFGQLLGIFIPQVIGGTAVFLDTFNPAEVLRAIHDEKVSVLVTVPRLMESLSRQVEREEEMAGRAAKFREDFQEAERERVWWRWWRFRRVHRRLGWKFWAIVSGGAALPADSELFWSRLGFAVIQGYGLTETTSLVSLNHPFHLERGSIGKALPGRDVKLAEDGEILVRGASIASGYWQSPSSSLALGPVLDEDGWFHTGDIGELDKAGRLYFKGRRKNVIVTPEGLNVYPGDLEAELRKEPAVRDCVVVGLDRDGNAEPCAALLLRGGVEDAGAAAEQAVAHANQRLTGFQQMRRWFVWPGQDFPRTLTQKPMLAQIREAAAAHCALAGSAPAAASASGDGHPMGDVLRRISGRPMTMGAPEAPLDLSSIERVELLSALEDRYQVDLNETEFSRVNSVAGLQKLIEQPAERATPFHYPRWAQSWPVRVFREAMFYLAIRPVLFVRGWPRVQGREKLRDRREPLLVIANHVTYFDPVYVMQALPARLRRKLAVAIGGETLDAMRRPPKEMGFFRGWIERISYFLVVAIFNVFPLPRQSGFRRSFEFAGDLIDRGWSVLVFPEGAETKDGRMLPFRAGIGLLAEKLQVPVLPIYLGGLGELKVAGKTWAWPGQVTATVGAPEQFQKTTTAEEITRQLESRVTSLGSGTK